MLEALNYLLAVFAGSLGATFYFGGLWLTVQRLADAKRPHLLLVASFLARAALILLVFFAVAGLGLAPLLVAIIVFLLARAVLTHRWGLKKAEQGGGHGSYPDAG